MKKILSLGLAVTMAMAALPVAYAADETVAHTQGTQVTYTNAAAKEEYTVTVPALLTPGGEAGTVIASGTMASNRKLTVTAPETITLVNSINEANTKTLDINFDDITMNGDNTQAVSAQADISVEAIENALFGTWSGTIIYTVTPGDA